MASMSVTVSLIISYEHIEIMKRNVGEQRGQRGTSFRWQDAAPLPFLLSHGLYKPLLQILIFLLFWKIFLS
jgi:hypothetical protein